MSSLFRKAFLGSLVLASLCTGAAPAADKTVATLVVKDTLTAPNQPETIEARLTEKRLLTDAGLGGEPLELLVDDKVVATAMTGGDGKAIFTYTPKAQGLVPLHVRVGPSPRVAAAEGTGNLFVWERRHPIVMVEMAALMEVQSSQSPIPGINLSREPERKPLSDAAEELGKLAQFFYRIIYVAGSGSNGFQAAAEARGWLKANKFPSGYVLVLPDMSEALGAKLDEFHAAGWKTVKTGIGRSRSFAEAFLQRRLEAVIVPEPAKGEAPRKAKVAKEWKEVRKKL